MVNHMALGEQLKTFRIKHGYTQTDIASLLDVEQSIISEYESGKRKISVDELEELGDLYRCDLIHDPLVVSPELQISSQVDNLNLSNLKAFQIVNRIVLNSIFMKELLEEE